MKAGETGCIDANGPGAHLLSPNGSEGGIEGGLVH